MREKDQALDEMDDQVELNYDDETPAAEEAPASPAPAPRAPKASRKAPVSTPQNIDEEMPSKESMTNERAWYVVHCYSGYENKVRHNLEQRIETMGMKDKIFDVVIPTQEEIEVKDGKRRTVERHVFPGYVLVNMIMTEVRGAQHARRDRFCGHGQPAYPFAPRGSIADP